MKTRATSLLRPCLLAALALGGAQAASAQTFPDWITPCGTPLGTGDFAEKYRLMRATAFLVNPANLLPSDIPGYYRLYPQPPGFSKVLNTPIAIGSQFYGEKQMSYTGRTGYLVAPDIIVTASHGYFNQNGYAIVFDMRAQDTSGTGSCDAPDFNYIPESNIIFPPHGDIIADFPDSFPSTITDYRVDYAAFRLTTPVTDRPYLRMRRNGNPEPTDKFVLASFPERMAMKFNKNVSYLGQHDIAPQWGGQPVQSVPRFTNYALMDGSSGGPMYNLTSGFVETAAGNPTGLGCLQLSPSGTPGYSVMNNSCPSDPERQYLNRGSIKYFASEVPPVELLVSPLGTQTQVIPFGGTLTTTSFSYDLKVDSRSPAPVNYSASVQAPAAGQPTLLSMTSSSGTIPIGGSVTKTATLSSAGITSCGVYEQTLQFNDTTHGFVDRIKHRIEAGLTDYVIEAPASARLEGIVSPYQPAQIQYTIRNPRPTATQVKVSNTATWLRIDGLAVPVSGTLDKVYNLAAAGSTGDSAVVTVTLDNTNANALASAEHSANLSFTNIGSCLNPAAAATRTQTVTLDKRQLSLRTDVVDLVPENATAQPLVSTINVAEAFCVTDIEVTAGFLDAAVVGNTAFTAWGPDLDLYLSNPTGQRLQLWDGSTAPGGWSYDSTSYDGIAAKNIRLNRSDRLPPNGANLDTFLNRAAAGNWTLEAVDQVVNSKRGLETEWKLTLKGTPGACPP